MKKLPDDIALALSHTHDGFACFMRSGRWGTYGSYPRLTMAEMQPVAFAAKMALAKVLAARVRSARAAASKG